MVRDEDRFIKVPRAPAIAWNALETFDRMVGRELYMLIGPKQRLDGSLAHFLDGALLGMGVDARNRKRVRESFARIEAAGLLLEHEGTILLLYGAAMWREHRALSAQQVNSKRAVSEQSLDSQSDLTKRNHSTPKPRKKTAASVIDTETEVGLFNHRPPIAAVGEPASGVYELQPAQLELAVPAAPVAAAAAPPRPKGVRKVSEKRDEDRALLAKLLADLAPKHGQVTPSIGQRVMAETIRRGREFAELRGTSTEVALARIVSDAYRMVASGRSSAMVWALRDWQPDVATRGRARGTASPTDDPDYYAGMTTWDDIAAAQGAAE